MDVRMESMGGHGQAADVWVGGELMRVYDSFTPPGERAVPGLLENVRFRYIADEPVDWDTARDENLGFRKRLDSVQGWAYVGYGQIVDIMPVRIDFGLLQMDDANWSTDRNLIGQYVRVTLDRLEIAPDDDEELF